MTCLWRHYWHHYITQSWFLVVHLPYYPMFLGEIFCLWIECNEMPSLWTNLEFISNASLEYICWSCENCFIFIFFPLISASISMSKWLPKKSCYNTPEAVLFVTESDDEQCDKTIDEIDEELSKVDLPLSDGENDDLTKSGNSCAHVVQSWWCTC